MTSLTRLAYLARVLRQYDSPTYHHCRRVRRYALCLALGLRLGGQQDRRLSLAAALHDVGKIAVPLAILHKAGPLTPDEWLPVRRHPEIGERLLATARTNSEVQAAVRGHHERYDGGGYPDGLAGDQIPLLSRILAIADSFDAMMSSDRAYRRAMRNEDALQHLRVSRGQSDPVLVLAFTACLTLHPGPRPTAPRRIAEERALRRRGEPRGAGTVGQVDAVHAAEGARAGGWGPSYHGGLGRADARRRHGAPHPDQPPCQAGIGGEGTGIQDGSDSRLVLTSVAGSVGARTPEPTG
jgi:HD superfamily phosphohydrolase YqeK